MPKAELAAEVLEFMKRFMIYKNPGLFWRKDVVRCGVRPGTRIGYLDAYRYRAVEILGRQYKEHHLVWLWHHGRWPMEIDHINRRKACNRIENLRECSRAQNTSNKAGHRTARTSKLKGVSFCSRSQRWRAVIECNGRYRSLGYFADEVAAAKVYDAAAMKLHGEFAYINFPVEKAG